MRKVPAVVCRKEKKISIFPALVDTTPEEEHKDDRPPDVFAIGFEEIVDLNATNIVQNTQWSENAACWGKELQKVNQKFLRIYKDNSKVSCKIYCDYYLG